MEQARRGEVVALPVAALVFAAGAALAFGLGDALEAVSDECELIGIEVTSFQAPEDDADAMGLAEIVADCVGAALGESSEAF